ncbi:hypothetical protein [Gemmatimonas sp.]
MAIDPETLLTDPTFLSRVEQAIRFTAGQVAAEARGVEFWEARQRLAALVADDAAAADDYARRFARLVIGDQAIENACAQPGTTSHEAITRPQLRNAVAPLWTLFASRLLKTSR